MYGITNGLGYRLCLSDSNQYYFSNLDRLNPVMKESAFEIDQLLQELQVVTNAYNLKVFKFTREEEERILLRKLSH